MAPPLHSRVLEGFLALGKAYRQEHGLGPAFEKEVKSFLAEAVAGEYWEPIRQYLRQSQHSLKDAGEAAGLNRSTISRLLRNETSAIVPTICLIVAWLGLDMKDVDFPTGRDARRRVFLRTVGYIRTRLPEGERGEEGAAPFDDEAWECLRLALSSPAVQEAVKAGGDVNAAVESVAREWCRRGRGGRVKDGEDVRRVFREWLIPWALFYTVVPYAERGIEP